MHLLKNTSWALIYTVHLVQLNCELKKKNCSLERENIEAEQNTSFVVGFPLSEKVNFVFFLVVLILCFQWKWRTKEVEEIHPKTHPTNVEMSLEWFGKDLCEWSQVVDLTLQLNIFQVIIFVEFDLVFPLKRTLLLPPCTSFNYFFPEPTVAS